MTKHICFISGKEFPDNELVSGHSIRTGIIQLIQNDYPGFNEDLFICSAMLLNYRKQYLEQIISAEKGDLSALEKEVVDAINGNELLSQNIDIELEAKNTVGQHVADKVAEFGGSWIFVISFFSFLFVWILINILLLASKAFDPYPFILLNLILSCLAAIQAPIIMMSQNRKEQKDRARNEHDYKVNLKAELEIRLLNEKVDHLIIHQNKRLLEIQELQLDYLNDLVQQGKKPTQ